MSTSPRRFRYAIAAVVGLAVIVTLAGRARAKTAPPRYAMVAPIADGGPPAPPTRVAFVSRGNALPGFLFPSNMAAPRRCSSHGSENDPVAVTGPTV
jgi:hypothetical protein